MPGPQFFYGAKPILFRRSFRTASAFPKRVSERGDVLLFGFVSDYVGAMPGPGSLMLFLCVQVSLIGVLKGLSGAFMPGQVIFFSVVLGAATMGMGSEVMVLGSYLLGFAHNRCRCTYCTVCRAGQAKACQSSQFGRIGKFRIPGAVFTSLSAKLPLTHAGSAMDHPVLEANRRWPVRAKGMA